MATITTHPATSSRWDDLQHALSGGGDGRGCQCIWPVLRDRDWNRTTLDQRRQLLHDEVDEGPAPGVIAYVDGNAAGWVRIGPRPSQQRIVHTRAIVRATGEPLDYDGVWSLTCFVVRTQYRGRGLNSVLLAASVDPAERSGARMIEAYPVDTSHGEHRPNDLYHATLSTFVSAGFTVGPALTAGRVLVWLRLGQT